MPSWSPVLAVVPVTIHVALREAVAQLTTRDIVETCTITASELTRRFDIANPRIAISGLNPHAGEDGTLGNEDEEIVAPAVVVGAVAGIWLLKRIPQKQFNIIALVLAAAAAIKLLLSAFGL